MLCKETPYRRHEDGSIHLELFEAGLNFSIKDTSHCLNVSENTLYRLWRVYNISKRQYNDLNDNALDKVVTEIVAEFPRCGEEMLRQLLHGRGIKVVSDSRLLLRSIVICIK